MERRSILFAILYLGEGAPIGFIWWALPTWLRTLGVPLESITGLTSLLVLPWVLKFLWAPLVDHAHAHGWRLRRWIVSAQLLMGASLIPLIWIDPVRAFWLAGACLVVHTFSAATQDVAVDALAIRLTPAGQRGRLNGAMQVGMLLGRSVFGGGALILAARIGWPAVIVALVGCISLSTLAALLLPEPRGDGGRHPSLRATLGEVGVILRRRVTWVGVAFALTAGAAFEVAGGLAGPMLVDRGLPQESIGWLFGIPVVVATMAGAWGGGMLADRFTHRRITLSGLVAIALVVVVLAGAATSDTTSVAGFFALYSALYLGIGVFTAGSYALFMDLSRPPLSATQFSAFMAATNGCEAWTMWTGGRLAQGGGYASAFLVMTFVSLGSLLFLVPMRRPAPRG